MGFSLGRTVQPSPPDGQRDADALAPLVGPATRGDASAMRALLTAVAPIVVRAACRMLGRANPDVEDVAQLALAAVAKRLPSFRGESSVAHFAQRIAVYRALSWRRDVSTHRRAVAAACLEQPPPENDGSDSPFSMAAARAQRALLLEALDGLSSSQAEALALHFLFDHTVGEIAAMTGATEETVRSRLRLGKRGLRAKIERNPHFRSLRDAVRMGGGEENAP